MSNGLPRRPARFTDVRRIFVFVGALLVAAGVANVVVFDWASEATAGKPYDFDLNWVAAQRLVDRQPLYDRAASKAEGLRLVGPEMEDTNLGPFSSFIGLPSTALLYAPFTPFDAGAAADLFRLVDLLAILAAIGITLLALPPPSRLPAGLIAFGVMLLSTSVNKSIWLGQVDGFLMLGLALAFFGVARGYWRLVGVGVAIAALLKFSPVLLLVYLALRGKWRAVWSALATVVVVLGVAAIIGPPGDLFEWFSHIGGSVSQGARNTDNQALPAVLARLFTHSNDLIAQVPLGGWRVVSYLVAAIGVFGLWWLRREHAIEPLDLGVLVLVALLAGPITWDHYTAWSLLVVVLIVDVARWAGRSWLQIALLAAPLAVAGGIIRTWTTYPLPPQVEAHWYLHATSSVKSVAMLLLLGVALWLLLRPAPATMAVEEADPAVPDAARPAPRGRMSRLSALRVAFLPWLVSRVLSVAVFLVAVNPPAGTSRFTRLATAYDGGFYFFIAEHGYGSLAVTQPRWAFFPGLPIVIKALDALVDPQVGLFVVNQLAFFLALAGVYVLARRHSSPRAAVLAVWALAIFPAAFVFSLSYPSSLFLAATVWAFVLVEDRHDLSAGVLAAGATLLRPNGVVVVVALLVAVAPAVRRMALICAPAVIALVVWCWYCYDRTGDAFAFLTAKSGWKEITIVGLFTEPGKGSALVHALLAVAAIAAVLLRRAHLPRAWLVFTVLYLVPSFVLGIVGLGRYANECFPAFVAAGQILAGWKPRVAYAALVVSAVGLTVMAVAVADHGLVP